MVNRLHALLFVLLCAVEVDLLLLTTTESLTDTGGGEMDQNGEVTIGPQPVQDADMEEDEARSEATFRYTVQQFSKFKDLTLSPAFYVRNLPWKIMVMARNRTGQDGTTQRSLGFFLQCNGENNSSSWSSFATAELRLLSVRPDVESFSRKIQHLFYSKENDWGFAHFMNWNDVLDPVKGYIKDDAITLEVHVVADASVSWDDEKHTKVKVSKLGEKSKAACQNYSKRAKPFLTPLTFAGVNAVLGEYLHMAALGYLKNDDENEYHFLCAGILISENYIVTAAHCVVNRLAWKLKIVRLGVVEVPKSVKELDPKLDYNVISMRVHKGYNISTHQNDIALVQLDRVNLTENVIPACLHIEDEVPEKMVVTGWGFTQNQDKSDTLQMASVTPIPLEECKKTFSKYKMDLIEKQICTMDKEGDDSCKIKSGGPLQVYTDSNIWTVIGVTSFGPRCNTSQLVPTIYTKINSYLDWIEPIVWP